MNVNLNRVVLVVAPLILLGLWAPVHALAGAPAEGGDRADQTSNARVRVAHASPDAPNVDVWLNGEMALENVAFGDVSDYAELPAGAYTVTVVATGTTEPAVIDTQVALEADVDYTVAASGTLAEIEPVVLVDDNAMPDAGQAHVRFVHLSPDAPAVDVAVAGGPVLFSNIAFQQASAYLPVDAGEYDLEVRVAGTDTVALAVPGVMLGDGNVNTVFAMGLLAGDPGLEAVMTLDAEHDRDQPPARLRVAHASPNAPNVDVWLNGEMALENVAFGDVSDYAELPAGAYTVTVVATGTTEPAVIDTQVALETGADYTVAASGTLAEIEALVLTDDNSPPEPGKAHVRFVHLSPDAPAVDVAVADGPVLFSNIGFQEIGAYLPVDAGDYDLEVRVAGTDTVALEVPNVTLRERSVFTVFAIGLAAGDPPLQAALTEDLLSARLRVVHASPDAPNVDVWVDGSAVLSDVSFGAVSDYLALMPGSQSVMVVPAGQTEPAVIDAHLMLSPGADYTVAAADLLDNIAPVVLMDDNAEPPPGMARVRFVHLSPDAPAVDIAVADGGPVVFSDVGFKQVGGYVDLPAGSYDLEVRPAGTDTAVLTLPTVSVESGTVVSVFALGLLAGDPSLEAKAVVDAEYETEAEQPVFTIWLPTAVNQS